MIVLVLVFLFSAPLWAQAQPPATNGKQSAAKPADAEIAIKRFVMASGIEANVFAADPQVANPVAFCFDEQGRMFVCETYRQSKEMKTTAITKLGSTMI
jgi:quinoprotein glucose dehydrogenase